MKDLTDLRKIAENATQSNWIPYEPGDEPGYWWVWQEDKLPWYGGIAQVSESDPGSVCQAMTTDGNNPEQDKADATHIATFDPPTILALITRLEQAEAVVARVRVVATGDPTEYGWSEAMLAVLRALDGDTRG
ncbi:ead/Ea22-like family protein [Glutamicibacter ardleyensis]|uniref:ead/Ea22-like family protein n=1 Tax=Glutamicibacter ardleyensis TaxID=225894 RepID=UPI003FD229DD